MALPKPQEALTIDTGDLRQIKKPVLKRQVADITTSTAAPLPVAMK